ncbi:rhomboid family intramembrane serine protease [Photobacterium japonica]|uniref:rhomboid family intramembrane serine protease n=1 Tax=Photobacterium japonica TaxID=2910235 RepID=UPI003D0E216D
MEKKTSDAISMIAVVVGICVVVHVVNVVTGGGLSGYGILPRHIANLPSIVSYPFLHGSWGHLISNMLSFSVLAFLVSRSGAARLIAVFLICWLGSGIGVWLFGRMNYHIGLSGVIYGLWAYLLVYAFMYRSVKSIVIAVVVMFFYGSMVWGVLPLNEWISFESHLFGALSGGLFGYIYARRDKRQQALKQ